ncbi:hypothetical protein GP475_06950 [Corynebacterium poyangense]|uniref:Uncharacterized protein n=1 Tax=Corynebacterium poyangense TaxID=2684405 RepID=A0A7H0SPC4_9CORY|nr:hypothetical protein [Corynebacterium poyangense]MBZ8177976.1 hypothetical protein [Corynebacterium poyangense]QNQ90399.1 hypothetical protein GP475_06950 [Corynebacterium poyangense]
MHRNLIIMPGSPALIAQLAPADAAGQQLARALEDCLREEHRAFPKRLIHLVGSRDSRWYTRHKGSLRAWGAMPGTPEAEDGHYLAEIIQRIFLGPLAEQRVSASRSHLRPLDPNALTLVAVDGSAGLTPRAPLAMLSESSWADRWCQMVVSDPTQVPTTTAQELKAAGVIEPDLWLELADIRPTKSQLLAADTSTGVGRYLGAWEIPEGNV